MSIIMFRSSLYRTVHSSPALDNCGHKPRPQRGCEEPTRLPVAKDSHRQSGNDLDFLLDFAHSEGQYEHV